MPRIELGADGVDVFKELINAMNLAYFIAKSLDCWNALFPVMFAQAPPMKMQDPKTTRSKNKRGCMT